MNRNAVKTRIEQVHLTYLCQNFKLCRLYASDIDTSEFKPDLYGPDANGNVRALFEVKSRVFPSKQAISERKRPISDFAWWNLDPIQIIKYTQYAQKEGLGIFWIFVLAQTRAQLTCQNALCERIITHRDILVLPWEIYKPISAANSGHRYIGLARIQSEHEFSQQPIQKGTLYVAKTIEEKVQEYFV